jgi:hypothetical protein
MTYTYDVRKMRLTCLDSDLKSGMLGTSFSATISDLRSVNPNEKYEMQGIVGCTGYSLNGDLFADLGSKELLRGGGCF